MPGPTISRPMTFTGCWTCKERKVRCDERPMACKNCEKRGLACGGYDIRLQWVSDPFAQVAQSNGKGRRSIKLDRHSGHRYRMREIDDFLATIDDDAELRLSSKKGPFSAFPVNARRPKDTETPSISPQIHAETLDSQDENEHTNPNDQRSLVTDLSNSDASYRRELTWEQTTHPTISITEQKHLISGYSDPSDVSRVGRSEDSIEIFTRLRTPSNTFSVDGITENDLAIIPANNTSDKPGMLELDPTTWLSFNTPIPQPMNYNIFCDAEVNVLFNHYRVHVSDLLQPILCAHNIYRQIYLPIALEGAPLSISDSRTSKALAHSALYHCLLAVSAFHLWHCDKRQSKYWGIGVKHRYEAVNCLQAAVNSASPGADYKVFMVAILSLVTVGVMSGESEDFLVHLNGASQLRSSRNRWRIISRPTRLINGVSVFLGLLARTTSFKETPSPWFEVSDANSFADEGVIRSSNCYEYMYGITPSIAAAIQETCRLAELMTWFENNPDNVIPDEILERCEALGDKLLAWRLSDERIALTPLDDGLNFTIFEHHANAWHLAALIYYYRRIQHCDAADLVEEVASVARHMNLAEDKKAQLKCHTQISTAPITWPSFIASCDAIGSGREVWMQWWERVEDYRIANTRTQRETIQRIWEKVDQEQERGIKIDWIQAFCSLGCHLLAV